jgi:hypothetical protein
MKKFLERDRDGTDCCIPWEVFVIGEKFDFEKEQILVSERFVNGELDRKVKVPCGVVVGGGEFFGEV